MANPEFLSSCREGNRHQTNEDIPRRQKQDSQDNAGR